MFLSNQTREDLKITGKHNSANLLLNLCSQVYINLFLSVNSFVEITQFLISVPGVQYVLPEKLCQDPVEAFFFWKQRAAGGWSDNPTVHQFCLNTVSLRVQGSAALEPVRGNCGKRQCSTSSRDMFGKQNDLGILSIEFSSYCKCTLLWHGIFIIHIQSMTLLWNFIFFIYVYVTSSPTLWKARNVFSLFTNFERQTSVDTHEKKHFSSLFTTRISNRFCLESSSVIICRNFLTCSLAALLRSSFSLKSGSVIKEQRAARTAMLEGYFMLTWPWHAFAVKCGPFPIPPPPLLSMVWPNFKYVWPFWKH